MSAAAGAFPGQNSSITAGAAATGRRSHFNTMTGPLYLGALCCAALASVTTPESKEEAIRQMSRDSPQLRELQEKQAKLDAQWSPVRRASTRMIT